MFLDYGTVSFPSSKSYVGLGFNISSAFVYLPAVVFSATYRLANASTSPQLRLEVPTHNLSLAISTRACLIQLRHLQFGSPLITGRFRRRLIRRRSSSTFAITIRASNVFVDRTSLTLFSSYTHPVTGLFFT